MKRAFRFSRTDVEGYNLINEMMIAHGYTEISQTDYLEVEWAKPDPILIVPPPSPEPPPIVQPPAPPPSAPPTGDVKPWWATLKTGDRVKLARVNVRIYYDPAPTAEVWNTLSDWREMDVFGVSGDWIQVKQYPKYNLWVAALGEDGKPNVQPI